MARKPPDGPSQYPSTPYPLIPSIDRRCSSARRVAPQREPDLKPTADLMVRPPSRGGLARHRLLPRYVEWTRTGFVMHRGGPTRHADDLAPTCRRPRRASATGSSWTMELAIARAAT